jgi:glycosyltransferase involved in cell wall biosynthesis
MIWVGYIVLILAAFRFIVSFINWATKPVLPENLPKTEPLVSVLIPVRNEADNIGNLLNSLKKQNYPNLEIIVCNDQSTDNTVVIAENMMEGDGRFKLIHVESLPDGWLGKNNACNILANNATGAYFCFLDADVTLSENFISSAIAFIQDKNVSLLTLFPQQIMVTWHEKAVVPIMTRILLSLLPLISVKIKYFSSLSAANGQCMLFSRNTYLKYMPHMHFKNMKAEDIAIARYFKTKREPIACILGNNQVYCRMYTNYTEAVNGFAKNINAFFGGSYILAFFYGLFSSILFLPIWFFKNFELFLLGFCLMFCTTLLNTIATNQKIKGFLINFILQELVFWHILYLSVKHKIKKTGTWKGRNI